MDAISRVYAWGDFFGYVGANEFTEFTRDWVPMVGAEHVTDDTGVAAHLYYGGHNSPMIARAGAHVQTAFDLDLGEPKWTMPISAGVGSITDTGVLGEVEVILSPAMPSPDFIVVPYPLNEPILAGKKGTKDDPPRPPWVHIRLKALPTLNDRFRLIIQKDTTVQGQYLDNSPTTLPTSAKDLSFGFLVYHA